ncbi:MAG: hypothetical protein Q9170_004394 [Blastenia crenularia]
MAFAQPAVKDNFVYNGDLYVDVGNLNRHKRASIAEITQVLRPDLKKTKNSIPVKDPVGHWYEAQLIHYGLPPSKDKARAKMRLLENLNSSSLKVPPSITAIESKLKKAFAAAERKAKAQHKAAMAATASSLVKPAQSKKRKDITSLDIPTQTPSVNVNINFGSLASPAQDDSSPAKKPKLQTARRGGRQSGLAPELSHAAFQQHLAPSSSSHEIATAGTPKPRTKQTARRSRPFQGPKTPLVLHSDFQPSTPYSYIPNESPEISGNNVQSSPPKKTTKPKKEPVDPKPKVKREPAVKKEATVKKEPKVKTEPKIKTEPNMKRKTATPSTPGPAAPSLGLINGIYDISCPIIEQEFPYDNLTIILTLDTPGIWGAYDFGMFSGILYNPHRPYAASNTAFEIRWRGRENGEGEMSFGEDCSGTLSFLGDGRIEGWMNMYGECHFEGVRREGPGAPVRTAKSMRDEWEGYNEDEYERERVGRWH